MDVQTDSQGPDVDGGPTPPRNDPQLVLWLLRILVPLEAYKKFVTEKEFFDDSVARLVGLDDILKSHKDAPKFDRESIVRRLRLGWEEAEKTAHEVHSSSEDDIALGRLGEVLGFSSIEIAILRFRLAVDRSMELRTILNCLGPWNHRILSEMLAICLGKSLSDVKDALSFESGLLASGLVELRFRAGWGFEDNLCMLTCLVDEIHCKHDDPLAYFRSRIVKSSAPRLTVTHFPHVTNDYWALSHYLQESISERRRGVNILIYGDPGTGKTEFVRMLSAALGTELYEVACATREGGVLDTTQRFRAYFA